MLKGDLASTPLPTVLRQLADGVASGCLHVLDGIGEEAKVFLRGGQVYAVQVPGRRPQLGARLVSSGALGPEGLAEALEAQRTELQGWRLGELLVHLGYVDQPVVEAFIHEQVREQTSDLMRWPTGTWKFRVNERTREDVAPPTPVEDLLEEVSARMAEWATITETVHGPDAVPVLSAAGQSDAEFAIDPEAWSLLCKVDGSRSIAELARECGFTLYEAGQVVYSLVRAGLLEVEEVLIGHETEAPTGSVASRLAAAFAPAPEITIPAQAEHVRAEEPSPAEVASLITAALRQDRTAQALKAPEQDEIDGSIDRVSSALSAALGTTTDESLFAAPKARTPKVKPQTPAEVERAAKKAEKTKRDAKRRERDSAELAEAQADLEAARAAQTETYGADHEAEIVNLSEVRRESARRDELEAAEAVEAAAAAAAAAAEAARLADEARLAQEQAAAAEAEAARLAQEQAAADAAAEAAAAAAAAEAARLAEEQAAADAAWEAEATRLREEQAHLEAQAAEAEAARAAEEARLADEAAAEQARMAEEEAAAQQAAAEQAAAEQAAAEQAAAEDQAAAARAQAEEELRRAAEEQAAADADAEAAAKTKAKAARKADEQAAAEAEHDEQVRRTAQRANASEAFAELSATAATSSDVQVLEVEAPAVEEVEEEPLPTYGSPDTDMASLFRELSSLGMEDEPAPAPVRPAAGPPRTPVAAAPPKKKKGLFGR